jgi:hypothetical protein
VRKMDELPVFFLVNREFEAIRRQERVLYEPQRLGPNSQASAWAGVRCISVARPSSVYGSNRVILPPLAWHAHMPYLKPVLAGLLASAIVHLCFLTWLHWKSASFPTR